MSCTVLIRTGPSRSSDLDADDLEELFSHLQGLPPVEVIADIRAREQLALVA